MTPNWGLINSCPVPVLFDVIALCYLQLLPIHTLRLGVEVDSFDGHHYISSVVPGGPVDTLNLLQPEDELLEVKHKGEEKYIAIILSSRKMCSPIDNATNANVMRAIYSEKYQQLTS